MIKFVVRIAGTDVGTGADENLALVRSDQYDADQPGTLINQCLDQVLQGRTAEAVKATQPMVSVELSADEADSGRPAFRLRQETIARMAEVGADLNFDPYVDP